MNADESFLQAVVLERDRIYCENARTLNRRELQGKIQPRNASNIRQWLVNAALRRHRQTTYRHA